MATRPPMTFHEKECELATIGLLMERAKKARDRKEMKKLREWQREVETTPTSGI